MAFLILEVPLKPINPILESLLHRLDQDLRKEFEERSGIMRFETGQTPELAEALAMLEVIRVHPLAVSGLSALAVKWRGRAIVAVTTDERACRQHFEEIGVAIEGPGDLAAVVRLLRTGAGIQRISR